MRAVTSSGGMTAEVYPFDPVFLAAVATRFIKEVRSVNRVLYDVTSNPPGMTEWE
jgi:GMP synthase (glutamine-hydrolysing)